VQVLHINELVLSTGIRQCLQHAALVSLLRVVAAVCEQHVSSQSSRASLFPYNAHCIVTTAAYHIRCADIIHCNLVQCALTTVLLAHCFVIDHYITLLCTTLHFITNHHVFCLSMYIALSIMRAVF
jgi:hypothetical protein